MDEPTSTEASTDEDFARDINARWLGKLAEIRALALLNRGGR